MYRTVMEGQRGEDFWGDILKLDIPEYTVMVAVYSG
jgi:hypothetical protein